MYGTGETYNYTLCSACGTLCIDEIPESIADQYALGYYSLGKPTDSGPTQRGLRSRRLAAAAGEHDIVGHLANAVLSPPATLGWLRHIRVDRTDSIADVGSGRGDRLAALAAAGFEDLTGFDPHLSPDVVSPRSYRLEPTELRSSERSFDLITYHHVLEHVADPIRELTTAVEHLNSEGRIVVRTPVMGCWAWRHYGTDWIQLDAPRHLNVLSESAVQFAAQQAGLQVTSTTFDGTPFQFWGSRLAQDRRPLTQATGWRYHPVTRRLAPTAIVERSVATVLNWRRRGDQAMFVLVRQ